MKHHDVNIIKRKRYIKGMPRAVFPTIKVRLGNP
jgi:hypothetical protein